MTEEKGDISSHPELSQLRDQKAEISPDDSTRSVVFYRAELHRGRIKFPLGK